MKTVLIEAHDLTLKAGTGIATYVRTLAETVQALRHSPVALYSTNVTLGRNPVLREIRMNDVAAPASWTSKVKRFATAAVGAPFGVSPVNVDPTGSVINRERELAFASFDHQFAVTDLYTRARRNFGIYGQMAKLRFRQSPDLFHASRPVPLQVRGRPNIYTVHDLVPLRLPYASLDRKTRHYKLVKEICRVADHVVTVSEHSKRDICAMFGIEEDRITNTYQASRIPEADLARSDDDVAAELSSAYGLDYKEYYLSLGSIEPKKNVKRLITAFATSRTKCPLIVVGALGWLHDEDVAAMNDERFLSYEQEGTQTKLRRRVQHLSYLPRERVIALLRGAKALVYPSIYEGFGLPVLEAMTVGTPVITSNVSALPELVGDAALTVDPYDVGALRAAIERVDGDGELRAELSALGHARAKLFSSEIYGQRLTGVYDRFLAA